jgi:enoyl-CoA hydratase/carnithine racemase
MGSGTSTAEERRPGTFLGFHYGEKKEAGCIGVQLKVILPTWAIRYTKGAVNKWLSHQVNLILDASLGFEMLTFGTADHKEATRAWMEKRKPQFKGF